MLKLFMAQGLAKDFLDFLFQLELGRTSEPGMGLCGAQDPRDAGIGRKPGDLSVEGK